QGTSGDDVEVKRGALGNPGGAQACVVGTASLRLSSRVTVAGGVAANSLVVEGGSVVNGGANINNVGGALVRISGATINGTVRIAGAAPSAANGQLINGAVINGPVITGAGQQAVLPTLTVTPGATSITENANDPPRTIAPGNYAAITVNGSAVTFTAGTYNVASLTINAGTVTFNTAGGAINVNVLGTIAVNGGTLSAGSPAAVTLYSNSSASNAITVAAGVATVPATFTAPNGGVSVGSRVTVNGCLGGRNVNIEPDSRVNARSLETLTVPTNGNVVQSALTYATGTTASVLISGQIVWGGCDPVNCPNGGSCNFTRLGDAQFHSDNCFTGSNPTFHSPTFDFPIQLFMNGAALPATPFAASHVYSFVVQGTGGRLSFNYNDIPGTFVDNSGSFTVTIAGQ
ncbi:MAG TPA: LecA/PA-IL family lectin, partial [Polyangia bacterium]